LNRPPELVFVYGTLRRGQVNHHWLEGCGFEGEVTMTGLVLHDLGPFPMAVPGDGVVHGELYRLEAMALSALDRLEGYPRLYDRLPRPLDDGRWAWVYVGRPRQVRFSPAFSTGRWPGLRALAVLLALLLAGAGGPAALAQSTDCAAWQRATGDQKVRLGNALGAAHYLTRLRLLPASAGDNPEAQPAVLYATSDLRRLCRQR
jgi:gamma-glutamylcyclotransferase (GGCT)/AIG2-like uncharacterized protein YtfP